MFCVYLIYSEKYDIYYIGQTNNLEDRLNRHNQNRCKYTKHKGPWILIAYKICTDRSDAVKMERQFKGIKSREAVVKAFRA